MHHRLDRQIRMRLLQYNSSKVAEDKQKQLDFLKSYPLKLDELDQATREQIDGVAEVIFKAKREEYEEVFCFGRYHKDRDTDKLLYKGDMDGLYDPKHSMNTLIEPDDMKRRELALLVIWQFASRVCRWIMRRARTKRIVEKLFNEVS